MSLYSFLQEKDVREMFRCEFPKPPFPKGVPLLAPPQTQNYALVGTAFDYLLRFFVGRQNDTKGGPWVASFALLHLAKHPALFVLGKQIVQDAKRHKAEFEATGDISDELLVSTLELARLDPIVRAGRGYKHIGAPVDDRDVADLRALISIVPAIEFEARHTCLLNPDFGYGSQLVGGADADLIIDHTLIDIKTTKKWELARRDFSQVVGYYALHRLSVQHGAQPKTEIRYLAIYFSRYGYLFRVPVEHVINPITFPLFLEWLEERAARQPQCKQIFVIQKAGG